MAAIVVPHEQIAVLSPQAIEVALSCGPIPGLQDIIIIILITIIY
jgi:hypothetical protein